jgi:thiosulfate reductase cytochrome b subunit
MAEAAVELPRTDASEQRAAEHGATERHARWVRISHWILAASLLVLAVSGVFVLMVHPRLYWGEVGNDLVPALLELPISRNHQHGGWEKNLAFSDDGTGPISASRTFPIFNQNGWARSLHFLAAWCLVVPGAIYLLIGLTGGHFRSHLVPRRAELAPHRIRRDVVDHLRFRIRAASGGPQYGLLQKISYALVVFVAAPLIVLTGLAMSPAVSAAIPLASLFGGYQSARTIHFFVFVALLLFVLVHVVMVVKSGFRRQIRAMTVGK